MSSSKELKQEFLASVFDQAQEKGKLIVELSQRLIFEREGFTELQDKDLEFIRNASQMALILINSIPTVESDFSLLEHELRTHLNSIVGFSDVLIKGIDGPVNKIQEDILVRIRKTGTSLLRLIRQALEVLSIEHYRTGAFLYPSYENYLWHIVGSVLIWIKQNANLEVEGEVPKSLVIQVDEHKLRNTFIQIASNLMADLESSRLIVTIKTSSRHVTIQFRNPDRAIEVEILDEFNRVVGASTLFSCRRFDTSLDFCISQAMMKVYGGDMSLNNRDLGSIVTFSLPVQYS